MPAPMSAIPPEERKALLKAFKRIEQYPPKVRLVYLGALAEAVNLLKEVAMLEEVSKR